MPDRIRPTWKNDIGLDAGIDVSAPVRSLRVAQRRIVEIANPLRANARIIAMDEPTFSLTPSEFERLVQVVAKLAEQGVSIIYVSHKMDEVLRLCSAATILNDGRLVGQVSIPATPLRQVIQLMVGRDLGTASYNSFATDREVLAAQGLTRGRAVQDASFVLHAGEVLGIAGLDGAVFAVLSDIFLTSPNLINILLQSSNNACIALDMTLIIISGGIDLSVGPSPGAVRCAGRGDAGRVGLCDPEQDPSGRVFHGRRRQPRCGAHRGFASHSDQALGQNDLGADGRRGRNDPDRPAGAAEPTLGTLWELGAMAAAAIGGASLMGGRGSIIGTLIGAITLGTLRNGLTLMNVQAFYQLLATGIIIIVAMLIDKLTSARRG